MPAAKKETKKKAVTNEVVTREYTINVHKRIHGMYVCLSFWSCSLCYCGCRWCLITDRIVCRANCQYVISSEVNFQFYTLQDDSLHQLRWHVMWKKRPWVQS